MAIKALIETLFGDKQECYIRLNNIEVSNHGSKSIALFRGYLTKEAFEKGKHFVFEKTIEFDVNVSTPIWEQAYSAVKTDEELTGAVDC